MKSRASHYLSRTCVTKHVLALMYDTIRGLLFAAGGGGERGGMKYAPHPLPKAEDAAFVKALADIMHWMTLAFEEEGVVSGKTEIGPAERELINSKIRAVNRWAETQQVEQWREMVTTLAALNLALFWCRTRRADSPAKRTLHQSVDAMLLRLGGAEEWMLAVDLFESVRGVLLAGINLGVSDEECLFFTLAAMPTPRSSLERDVMSLHGRQPDVVPLLAGAVSEPAAMESAS